MMKIVKIIVSIASICSLMGCREKVADEGKLTVSIEPQRFLLESIAGPKWHVTSLLSRGEDPENFDPPMSALRDLYDSKAYFPVGTIEFEHHLLEHTDGGPTVFDTSQGITLISGTHCNHHDKEYADDHHHDTDPHIWSSLRNARIMAGNMLDAMISIDPADSAQYRENYRKLTMRLDSAAKVIERNLAPVKGESFMVWHPSLSYFAADYGLHQIPLGMDNKEMSVSTFRSNIDYARTKGARVLILQPGFDSGQTAGIAAQAGIDSYTANTLAYDLIGELLQVSRIIANPQDPQL